ncbi:Type II secretion system protein I [Nymphon striatum]|nr:Type II secretion system protein I [Nymphon striatum]
MAGAVVMSIPRDINDLLKEQANRFQAVLNLSQDEAIMQSRELALGFTESGYTFFEYNDNAWSVKSDGPFKARRLPSSILSQLYLEGVAVSLDDKIEVKPQVFILSSDVSYRKKSKSQSGFTLLEIMIALLIVAVAMGGAIKSMGNSAKNSISLSDKTFAQWVGMNQFTKLRLSGQWPKPGETKGDEEMAHRKWSWVQKISKTPEKKVNRVEISIWDSVDQDVDPTATIVGFLAQP